MTHGIYTTVYAFIAACIVSMWLRPLGYCISGRPSKSVGDFQLPPITIQQNTASCKTATSQGLYLMSGQVSTSRRCTSQETEAPGSGYLESRGFKETEIVANGVILYCDWAYPAEAVQ